MMTDNSTFSWADEVSQEDLGDSIVLGDASGNHWIVLKGTAPDVWRLLNEPRTLDDLTLRLTERYQGDNDQIRSDVQQLLITLLEKGFIHRD